MMRGAKTFALAALLAVAPAAGQDVGLDALPEDRLLGELAGRNLDALLNQAFDALDVPREQRQAYTVSVALARLAQQGDALPPEARRQAVANVVDNIGGVLPTIDDPQLLVEQASTLVFQGMAGDVSDLELWGNNPQLQARLKPVAEAAIAVIDRALELTETRLEQTEARIDAGGGDAAVEQYRQFDLLAQNAAYTRQILNYYLALSLDAADPRRGRIAAETADYLGQVAENSRGLPDALGVLNFLGKTALLVGTDDGYDTARQAFDEVIEAEPADFPDAAGEAGLDELILAQQYTARYFRAVTELKAGDVNAAAERADELKAWTAANLPGDAVSSVYADVLRWRVTDRRARLATGEEKQRLEREATDTLARLADEYPAFRPVVMQQVEGDLPASPNVTELNRLQLLAAIDRASDDFAAATRGETYDEPILQTAAAAAAETLRRPDVGAAGKAEAAWQRGLLLEALGRDVDAAGAYLAYAADHAGQNVERGETALEFAEVIIGRLSRNSATAEDARTAVLRSAFLPVAIAPPYGRTRFVLPYGTQLLRQGDAAEAIEVLRRLAPGDEDYELGQYYLLLALSRRLDELPEDAPQRPDLLGEVQRLAAEVTRNLRRAVEVNADNQSARRRLAGVRLQAAELALDERDEPAVAVEELRDFEDLVALLPDGQGLLAEALFLRFRALTATGSLEEATRELLAYVRQSGPERGVQLVLDFLETLDAQYQRATRRGEAGRIESLAEARASLTPKLVQFAQEAGLDEAALYTYRRYDADSKRIAGEAQAEPGRREALLRQALAAFEALRDPANEAIYQQMAGEERVNRVPYDATVILGEGRAAYLLGDWATAEARFGRLLQDGALGRPVNTERDDDGEVVQAYNDNYWEALVRWLRAKQAQGEVTDAIRTRIRSDFIRYGDNAGGPRWHDEYVALREEVLPDFDPDGP